MAGITPPVETRKRAKREAEYRAAAALLALSPYEPAAELPPKLLERHYGLKGSAILLASEFERTLAIEVATGQQLILKLSDRPEARNSFRFQSTVLRQLEDVSDVQVPRVLETIDGKGLFADGAVCGYLQTRIGGTPLHALESTEQLLAQVGATLARLGQSLRGVEAPAPDRPVLWQIGTWPWLEELLPYLPAGSMADQVKAALSDYLTHVEPRIGELDWQITHNDPSPHNMFLTDGVIAFIDFGDGSLNPRIQDLAIAASHFVTDPGKPLGGAAAMIAGFHAVQPLTSLEARLLVGLMRARQSALILINHWRADLFPDEASYIRKNVLRAQTGLAILSALDADAGERAVRSAMNQAA
jgi:Ser/Thr protein kinase RdoA (MazF antagonist)